MDTIIVAMRCGQSGRPFRVEFTSAARDAPYAITGIVAGSGLTVAPVQGERLLEGGGAPATKLDPLLVDADGLDWRKLRCPHCHLGGPPVRCPTCEALLCLRAALPPEGRLSFLCPMCGWKTRKARLGLIGRLLASRRRPSKRRLQLSTKEFTALPPATGLLGPARRLLPGPKRDPQE